MACESCLNGCVTPQHCACDCVTCAEANSCDIPVGDVGPQGPVGPMGPPGAPCIPCTNGTDGADGCNLTDVYISDGTDGNTAGDIIVETGTAAPCPQTINAGNIITSIIGPGGAIPAGIIVMWHGPLVNIPVGWEFCDGNNGTPDLQGHFIGAYGTLAGHAPFNTGINNTGGGFNVNLTQSQIPAHTHSGAPLTATTQIQNGGNHRHQFDAANGTAGGMADKGGGGSTGQYWTTFAGIHNHAATTSIGGVTGDGTPALSAPVGSNIDITNKYYVLAFIMKV